MKTIIIMGGKALNRYGVFTERKTTEELRSIALEIKHHLMRDLKIYGEVVRCYHTKADHGDLDLLLKITDYVHNKNVNLREYIQEKFKPNALHFNGGVYSFDYKNFQIDFIPIRMSKWYSAVIYYSYDPLGNIMGKTFHKFGLSYGWDGLFYKFRNFNGRNSQNILLTTDAKRIFEFGGYDFNRYLYGFENLEDIFKFAISSKYFDTEIFQMDNLKSIDKKRNRKRGSYHLFLNYLKENGINTRYPFEKDKSIYLPMIENAFPEVKFLEKLEKLREKDELNKQLAEKFNGNLIMGWLPDLKGKELGEAITKFKKMLGESYDETVLNSSTNELHDLFLEIYGRPE